MAITLSQPSANRSEVYTGSNHGIQINATGTMTYNQMIALVDKDSAPKTQVYSAYSTSSLSYKYTIPSPGAYQIQVIGTNSSGGEQSVVRTVTVAKATISNYSTTMNKGTTQELKNFVTVTPSSTPISWDSSNTGVATVNSTTGLVTAVDTGSATINIRISGTTMILISASITVAQATSKKLTMPQKYSNKGESTTAYTNYDPWVQKSGCSVACAINVSAYYNNTTYTLAQVTGAGKIYQPPNLTTMYWTGMPNVNINRKAPPNNYLSIIKSEIDANRPVIIHSPGGNGHWVVAYGYTNNAASAADILVIDSANGTETSSVAVERTLSGSWTHNGTSGVDEMITTNKKPNAATTW